MDSSVSIYLDSRASPQTLASRKRKVIERSVVRVKMGEKYGKVKNEGPPSDSWSWRKYGQKPIKGSPFPRGYYRCSTSKGCSAKKQVERCRTDASMLVITYTSTHNHPSPGTHSHRPSQNPKKKDQPLRTPKQEDPHEEEDEMQRQDINYQETSRKEELEDDQAQTSQREGHHFHYIESPLSSPSPQEMMINQQVDSLFSGERSHDITLGFMLDEEPINASCLHHDLLACSSPKSEGNDFFDELEELPTALPFTSFMKNNCFRETIPPVHS